MSALYTARSTALAIASSMDSSTTGSVTVTGTSTFHRPARRV